MTHLCRALGDYIECPIDPRACEQVCLLEPHEEGTP